VLYRVTRWYLKFHRFLRSRAETDAAGDVAKKKPRSVMTCMPAMPKLRNPTPTCDLGCVPRFPGWANQRGSVSSDLDDTEDVTCEICFESDESPETAIFQRGSPQSNVTSKLFHIFGAAHTAASSKVQVIVSDGAQPGDLVHFDYNGLEYNVVVPDGVFAGMRFMADVAPPSTLQAAASDKRSKLQADATIWRGGEPLCMPAVAAGRDNPASLQPPKHSSKFSLMFGSPQSNVTSKWPRRHIFGSAHASASSKVQVIVSDGAQPGDLVHFDYNGLEYDVVVPDGVFAGMRFMADVAPPSTKHLLQDTQQAALIRELMSKKKLEKDLEKKKEAIESKQKKQAIEKHLADLRKRGVLPPVSEVFLRGKSVSPEPNMPATVSSAVVISCGPAGNSLAPGLDTMKRSTSECNSRKKRGRRAFSAPPV
jgi:hypothetical protein